MKNKILLVAGLLLSTVVTTAQAHPGRTASDGCHYCRTNCTSWGVPAGQRHCHGGSGVQADIDDVMRESAAQEVSNLPHSHEGVSGEHVHEESGKPVSKERSL